MTRLALLAALPIAVWVLHPTPAWPDAGDVRLTEPREDDGSLKWILHSNSTTSRGEYAITLDVEGWGTIVGTLVVSPDSAPDTLVILDVPPGLAVVPPGVTTAEGAMSVLKVYEAVGM